MVSPQGKIWKMYNMLKTLKLHGLLKKFFFLIMTYEFDQIK